MCLVIENALELPRLRFFFFLFPSSPWGQIKLEIFFFFKILLTSLNSKPPSAHTRNFPIAKCEQFRLRFIRQSESTNIQLSIFPAVKVQISRN